MSRDVSSFTSVEASRIRGVGAQRPRIGVTVVFDDARIEGFTMPATASFGDLVLAMSERGAGLQGKPIYARVQASDDLVDGALHGMPDDRLRLLL
jgi:hypothetical protein